MELLERVKVNPNICSIELAFQGILSAANIPDWQQFYNSSMYSLDFSKTYIGLGSVAFSEESEESAAGTSYKQSVTIRFPSTDKNRSERIALMDKVKFVKLKLTNGLDLVIGRNDFEQNARPRIKIKTNVKTAEAVFETVSIFPAGFVVNAEYFGLPIILK
jgi:coproporphyrinogen III oxidase-like Fe-S oxidoreductase